MLPYGTPECSNFDYSTFATRSAHIRYAKCGRVAVATPNDRVGLPIKINLVWDVDYSYRSYNKCTPKWVMFFELVICHEANTKRDFTVPFSYLLSFFFFIPKNFLKMGASTPGDLIIIIFIRTSV